MKIEFWNTHAFDSLQVSFQQGIQGEDHIVAQALELKSKDGRRLKTGAHREPQNQLMLGERRRPHSSIDAMKWGQRPRSPCSQLHPQRQCPGSVEKESCSGVPWWRSGKNLSWNTRTPVWCLVWEDSHTCRAAKPAHCNYWARALERTSHATEPTGCNNLSLCTRKEKPLQWEARSARWRVAPAHCN